PGARTRAVARGVPERGRDLGPGHRLVSLEPLALLPQEEMGGCEGRAQGSAGIPRGRLDPDVTEVACLPDLAVRHAVQGNPSREAEIRNARFRREGLG